MLMFVALLTVVPQFESCTDAYICVFASWGCWRSPTIRVMQMFVSVLSWGWWGSITTISHSDVSCVSVSWGHSLSHSDVCVNLCSFRLMALSPTRPARQMWLAVCIVCGCLPDRPHYEPIRDTTSDVSEGWIPQSVWWYSTGSLLLSPLLYKSSG